MKLDKNKKLAIFITIATIIILGGITYTFFSSTVSNANNEKINTETATMRLEFDDNDNGVSGTLNLGESIIKKFTLENTGTVDAYGKINWYNLVNTYLPNSLTWFLEQSTTENGTYTTVGSGSVPTSTTATTKVLKNGLFVPINTTYYYKLTITLNNLNIDQSSDINASMNSKFSLENGSVTATDQILNMVADANPSNNSVITKTAPTGASCTNTFAYDNTADNNLRYIDVNPCNYVSFNDESPHSFTAYEVVFNSTGAYPSRAGALFGTAATSTLEECEAIRSGFTIQENIDSTECQQVTRMVGGWRIIGVMNNVDDGTGNLETRLKLIRNDALNNKGYYSWDSSDSTINSGKGENEWIQADLMTELNTDYLSYASNSSTTWYNGQTNQKTGAYSYSEGLKPASVAMIGDTKWYLGPLGPSWGDISSYNTGKAVDMYKLERGDLIGNCAANSSYCPRARSWTGKIALAYPSDYGFGISGPNRGSCIISSVAAYGHDYCWPYNWLNFQARSWLLTPVSYYSNSVMMVSRDGYLYRGEAYSGFTVRPTFYLKSNVKITGGNGSPENPYTLG